MDGPYAKKFFNKLILNGFLRLPDPESAIKNFSGGEPPPQKKFFLKDILNGFLRVPAPESEKKNFSGGGAPPPPKKKNFFGSTS